MIKKTGYAVIAASIYGIFESLIYSVYGFEFLAVFFLFIFFSIALNIISFNNRIGKNFKYIKVRRELNSDVMKKKERTKVNLYFKNESRTKLYFNYFDTLSDVFSLYGDYSGFVTIKPGETIERHYEIAPNSIGKYKVGPIKIYSEDPMRLSFVQAVSEIIHEVKVGPSNSDTFTQRSERLSNFIFTTGIHRSAKAGSGYNFFGVRQYNDSDDFRHVAWTKYGILNGDDLYVKEWEEERQIDVLFLIDYSNGTNIGNINRRLYDTFLASVINASYLIFKNRDGVGYLLHSSIHDIFIPPVKSSKVVNKLEKVVSEIRPDGTFSISSATESIKKNLRKNAMVLTLMSPHYAVLDSNLRTKDLLSGRQQYNYIMDPRGYFNEPENDAIVELSETLFNSERLRLETVAKAYNHLGLRVQVTNEDTILQKMIADYSTGRMANRGA
jgi:uncharacterized protein (DUF58 family)